MLRFRLLRFGAVAVAVCMAGAGCSETEPSAASTSVSVPRPSAVDLPVRLILDGSCAAVEGSDGARIISKCPLNVDWPAVVRVLPHDELMLYLLELPDGLEVTALPDWAEGSLTAADWTLVIGRPTGTSWLRSVGTLVPASDGPVARTSSWSLTVIV